MRIPVLFESEEILAVDKPVGISVYNNEDPDNLLKLLAPVHGKDLFPIHRLDKETSGVQIFARSSKAASSWAQEFQERSVKKIYCGVLRGAFKIQEGYWRQPLTDKSEGRKNPQGSPRDQVPCETKFRVLKQNRFFSFLEFDLKTGRQHQIRKHAALENHALVGDSRYGDPKYNGKMAGFYKTDRMFLHCQEIEIKKHRILSPVPEVFALLFKEAN